MTPARTASRSGPGLVRYAESRTGKQASGREAAPCFTMAGSSESRFDHTVRGTTAMQAPFFILEDHAPTPATNVDVWLQWMVRANRRLKQDQLPNGLWVSTVFLGYDPDRRHEGPPRVFETVALRGAAPLAVQRYATWDAADAGHRQLVQRMRRYRLREQPRRRRTA